MMTIKSVHIKNFRSIVNETIELKDFNTFVGKNDSGKSNVLKALNLFFNEMTDFATPLDFENDYSKLAKRGKKQAREIVIELEIVVPDSFKEHGIKVWKKVWRSEGLHKDNKADLFKSGSKGLTFLNRIQYLYIPAVKSDNYFKGLLTEVYASMTQAANSALKDLNDQYSEELQSLTSGLTHQLQVVLGMRSAIQMPANLSTLFRDLNFSTSDSAVSGVDLSRRGDGIKARHIPSILRYIQHNTENGRPRGSIYGSYIWGFEEPENGVEYLACYQMAQEFLSYTSDCQILITTHSPAFYSRSFGEDSVCYLTTKEKGASKYKQNSQSEVNSTMGLMQFVAPFIETAMQEYIEGVETAQHNLVELMRKVMSIMQRTPNKYDAAQVLSVVEQFSSALDMLDDYDHQRLQKPAGSQATYILTYDECRSMIDSMKFAADSDLFGHEKDDSFKGSIGNIYQSFGGIDVYPSVEEKAANLLYFITKNHSFSDGNKRIAAAMFLHFLDRNDLLFRDGEKVISDHTLVAVTVMIAESNPDEKETMIKLIMNFLK